MSLSPVVVVTGANAGIGYGICRRLLFQLCVSNPPDSWPQSWARASDIHGSGERPRYDGLTLIMACRSTQRAGVARNKLYSELDAHIAQLRAHPDYDGHADVFRRKLKIEVEYLDLAVLSTVFNFAAHMSKQYTYISHLIFNAGVANFTHIDWAICLKQLAMSILNTITKPAFNVQSVGEVSVDGLGWIWQSNLFGHYVLFRALEPLLQNPAYPADSRVLWSSSLESSPRYDPADWQLTKTAHSYESVKYQIDLLVPLLDQRALQDPSSPLKRTRHLISHPGICHTHISTKLVAHGGILDMLKIIAFYFGRVVLGSRHHPITADNGAIAAVHLILVSLSFVTFSLAKTDAEPPIPLRFGSETDRWGHAEVGTTVVEKWKENKAQGELLLEKCDEIYQNLSAKQGTSS